MVTSLQVFSEAKRWGAVVTAEVSNVLRKDLRSTIPRAIVGVVAHRCFKAVGTAYDYSDFGCGLAAVFPAVHLANRLGRAVEREDYSTLASYEVKELRKDVIETLFYCTLLTVGYGIAKQIPILD